MTQSFTAAQRFQSLNGLFARVGGESFVPPPFEPEGVLEDLQENQRILVVGAGGLGCELLKNLALSGFKDIHVIDIDTIELSNLNRQFLFRKKDIGRSKADTAAEFIMKRCTGVNVKAYTKKIQEFAPSFYKQFNVVIAGLDNVEARRWLNSTLVDLVEVDEDGDLDPDSIIPFIDGGTEGFKGQARLFIPRVSSCFECSVSTLPKQTGFAVCTIANVPRLPEHCVAYAKSFLWPKLKSLKSATEYDIHVPTSPDDRTEPKGVTLDTDNVEHMTWLYHRSLERAQKFQIEGVTYSLTMQVVKNIIPAIASTNALIAAACTNEALKIITWASLGLQNYFMYMGQTGVYSNTFNYEKNHDCIVCGSEPIKYEMSADTKVSELLQRLKDDPATKLKNPSVAGSTRVLYMSGGALKAQYQDNLIKTLGELITSGEDLKVTDPTLGRRAATLKVMFSDPMQD